MFKQQPADLGSLSSSTFPFWETLRCLKKDPQRPKCHLLIDPHLLYLTDEQAAEYLEAIESPGYSNHVHRPVVSIIETNIKIMFDGQKEFSLIELGPGYPDMSLPIAKYCKSKNIPIHYYPVDISSKYLKLASEVIAPHVTSVCTILAKFEDCRVKIPSEAYSRQVFLMIGLTFMNFDPDSFIPTLKDISGPNGKIIMATELVTNTNPVEKIIANYQGEGVKKFTFGPLINLRIPQLHANYVVEFYDSRIECGFAFTTRTTISDESNEYGENRIIDVGEKVITAISYRYALNNFSELLRKHFNTSELFFSEDRNTSVALNSF
jgi:hypothetical protein